ncbi:MAG: Ycf48-like protein [Candidatus Marinimicrobia bacterium]|nr:Ycf48-like protein [Candidatus Neomarinimicrobiota bacterium]
MIRKTCIIGLFSMLLSATVVTGQSIPDTWTHQYTFPDSIEVRAVAFTDSLHGWAVGEVNHKPVIIRTQDAGLTWTIQVSGDVEITWLNDIALTLNSTGWAVGQGASYQTDDGGDSWTTIPIDSFACDPYVGDLQDVALFSAAQGIIVGTMNTVITTDDAGATWNCQTLMLEDGFIDTLHTVEYLTPEKLVATGMGGFAHSQDSGATWHMNHSAWEDFHVSAAVPPRFAWTISRRGHLFRTQDAGLSWSDLGYVYSENNVGVRAIAFHDSLVGWVCTSDGTIWETDDGGETWEETSITPGTEMVTVGTVSGQIAYATNAGGEFYIRRSPVTSVQNPHPSALPDHARLAPAYPNPFNGKVTLTFQLPEAQQVSLAVYDLSGRQVALLDEGLRNAGDHTIRWNPGEIGSGVYFIELQATGRTDVQRVMYLK